MREEEESWLMLRFLAVALGPFIVLRQGTRSSRTFDRKDYKFHFELTDLAAPVIHLHDYSSRHFKL